MKDIGDGLRGGNVNNRLDRPDDRSDRPDDRPDGQYYETKEKIVIDNLLNKIDNINKKYKDTIDNVNKENDDCLIKIEEQKDDVKELKKEIIDNKKLTKDILDELGKKINKFYQERLKYFNEFRYELERKSRIIEQKDDLLRDIVRHTGDDINENQTKIDVLQLDLEHLNNLNQEYLDKINNLNQEYLDKKNKYNENINDLKDDLIDKQYVRKELYENVQNNNKKLENSSKDS